MALTGFGGPERLTEMDLPDPQCGPTDVVIDVHTVAANRQDLSLMEGHANIAKVEFPHIPGIDPAGVVVAVGEIVDSLLIGDRVVVKPSVSCGSCSFCAAGFDDACTHLFNIGVHRQGGLAQYVAVPARNAFRISSTISFAEASAAAHTFPVALNMLYGRAEITADDTVLVTGAAGSIGSALTQVAKLAGARVIAAARGQDRVAFALRRGADEGIDYARTPHFSAFVRTATDGLGVSIYAEPAGDRAIWNEGVRSLARRGRIVVCGVVGGTEVPLDLGWLYRTRASVLGSSGSSLAQFATAIELIGEGKLRSAIDRVVPFVRAREAYEALASRQNLGKVVIEVKEG